MAVVWVVSHGVVVAHGGGLGRLTTAAVFDVVRSVSALVDLRFLSSSFERYLHQRVGPLPVAVHRSSRTRWQD